MNSGTARSGFTLIELMVVIGIIAILMAVLIGMFGGSTESARTAKCQANMRNLAMAVQAYGMETHYYPYAGSFEKKAIDAHGNATTTIAQGWIGSDTKNYISPYVSEGIDKAAEKTLEKGSIWKFMKGVRDCYVCPSHLRYAKEKNLGTPLWSYAMNAYFDWASNSKPRYHGHTGKYYTDFKRSDRYLLFAELALDGATSGTKTDPVLQYQGCAGGGDELIGFNHKEGRNTVGIVCFADGHVEKLRAPKAGSVSDLTKWLCVPRDSNGDFDISFDGKEYKQLR